MPKRLAVFADGTWNKEGDLHQGLEVETNVAKLKAMVCTHDATGDRQLCHYQPGVGTHGGFDTLLGGVGGYGISNNILACYCFLVNNYEEGDEIFMFGFSRGAYTVRSLAGLIRNCGLLHEYHANQLMHAYTLYRDRTDDTHPSAKRAKAFRRRYARKVEIKCVGVWDTVGSLGIPDVLLGSQLNPLLRLKLQFHDVTLSSWVKNAFHAIAIDERRKAFTPAIWRAQGLHGQHVEQIWFPGVHCDVGGGYIDHELSDIALHWMAQRAASCGLALNEGRVLKTPRPTGQLHNSMSWTFRPFGAARRTIPRENSPYIAGNPGSDAIHPSALERLRAPRAEYYPSNLLEYIEQR